MKNTNKIIRDIKDLRGKEVEIFGQKTVLNSEVEEGMIDILDILYNLRDHEMTYLYTYEYNEETDEYDETETESVEDYLEQQYACNLKEITCGNSYNWGGMVSNDFNFTIYEHLDRGTFIVEFRVHRFGDVRGNYTETALYEFGDDYDFWETIRECDKYITRNGLDYVVSALNDGYDVFNEGGSYIETVCELPEEGDDEE